MIPLLFEGLIATGMVGGLLGLGLVLGRERRWREAAESCGFTCESSRLVPFVSVTARSGPVQLRLVEARYGAQVTATVLGARPELAEVSLRRELITLPGTREVEIGDEDFDDSFLLKGPEQFVAALLDEPARRMLRQAAGETSSLAIDGNQLRAEVRAGQLPRLLPLFRDLGRRFAELQEVPQRLAENVRRDPEPGVRRHNLRVLLRDYSGYPCAEEAVRAASQDESVEVRLEAAGELGDVGTLAEIMARDSSGLALAAARALGATGAAAAEAPLLTALARDNPELQEAVAEGLGRVGSVESVLPLQEIAGNPTAARDLRRAARYAIAEIQSRLSGAAPGQLSLAVTEAGQLSLASDPAGRLSLPEERAG